MHARILRRRVAMWIATPTAALATTACVSSTAMTHPSPFPGAATPAWAAGTVGGAPSHAWASAVVRDALSLRGTPYRLGGDRPTTGFDCSGLVRYVFEQERIDVPRTVAEQFAIGRHIDERRIQTGDLVFFTTTAAGPTHVGIALDPTNFVHAPGSGSVVRVESLGSAYWSSRLIGVRRVGTGR